ncbi:MAG: flagellar protein export ATPase FliI [Sphingobium sp.]|nr:flagellar protein export ATPase FliI [Sphingobium sp.]MCP5398542.1 flagellar protein export ATPase FliI [Sphingomonas sp.]
MRPSLSEIAHAVRQLPIDSAYGQVAAVQGAMIEVEGLLERAAIGAHLRIDCGAEMLDAEITGLDRGVAHCLPFTEPRGLSTGAKVHVVAGQDLIRPSRRWLGRMIDGLGRPVDGKGPLPQGGMARPVRAEPPPAASRERVGDRIETGVRALDMFAPLCIGQRLGLFAGSGVGKSVLLSMLARWTQCDIAVIGLIGERGREVQEFVEDDLGPEGLERSVLVVATSDAPALMRRQAAWTTLAVAEHFRDQGLHVLCLMDSVTRFAMAQREIGLANGEPPASRGYTPSVFAELPRLLERAGPGMIGQGSITGLFTVLVDGGDHDEPVADAVRGILDGHIVLSRSIAEQGRYPAIDLLKSVSRTLPHCLQPSQNALRMEARSLLSLYGDMEEMVRLGAYRSGSNPEVDRAMALAPQIEQMLRQDKQDRGNADGAFTHLSEIIAPPPSDDGDDA